MSDHGLFSPSRATRSGQDSWGFFKDERGFGRLDLARRLHQLKASTAMDLGISIFPYFCTMCGLEKLGLVDRN